MKEISAETIAEELRGTCKTLECVLEENDAEGLENSMEFCAQLDDIVFCCESCGWWCETSEMGNEQQVCFDCEEA